MHNALTLSQFCSSLAGFALAMIYDSFPNPQLHYSVSPFPQSSESNKYANEYIRIMQYSGAPKHYTHGFR